MSGSELSVVTKVIDESGSPEEWQALAASLWVEAYTDGSAPVRNPGGPAGFGAVLLGYPAPPPARESDLLELEARPAPLVMLDLAGYIKAWPQASNNRAELSGVLAALTAVQKLYDPAAAWPSPHLQRVVIWTDSQLTVKCGTGVYKRSANLDLWEVFQALWDNLRKQLRLKVELRWVKGHSTSRYNNRADQLASLAAYNFSTAAYDAFRTAQQKSGKEIPSAKDIATTQLSSTLSLPSTTMLSSNNPAVLPAPLPVVMANPAQAVPDYTITLGGVRSGIAASLYEIETKDGRQRREEPVHQGNVTPLAGEYLTVITALKDLLIKIEERELDPGRYHLRVLSAQQVLSEQLAGRYKVAAPALLPLYTQARSLLDRFGKSEIAFMPNDEIKARLGLGTTTRSKAKRGSDV